MTVSEAHSLRMARITGWPRVCPAGGGADHVKGNDVAKPASEDPTSGARVFAKVVLVPGRIRLAKSNR